MIYVRSFIHNLEPIRIPCAGAGDYHNLQVSDAFGVKPGGSVTAQGPRSCYIPNE